MTSSTSCVIPPCLFPSVLFVLTVFLVFLTNSTLVAVAAGMYAYTQRRADGQGVDAFMHANPFIEHRGLAMVFNPTTETMDVDLVLPLYYTGITEHAGVAIEGQNVQPYALARDYSVTVPLSMPPKTLTYVVITSMD